MEEFSTGLAVDGSRQYGSNTGDRRNSLFAILQQFPRFLLRLYKLTLQSKSREETLALVPTSIAHGLSASAARSFMILLA
jgi:hypothetical protein